MALETCHHPHVGKKRRLPPLPPGVGFQPSPGPHPSYETGTGCGAAFWFVIVVPFAVVGVFTSGVVSDVFWGLAGLWVLLAVVSLAYFVTGHGRGGWKEVDQP
jgi:hypothetical protein